MATMNIRTGYKYKQSVSTNNDRKKMTAMQLPANFFESLNLGNEDDGLNSFLDGFVSAESTEDQLVLLKSESKKFLEVTVSKEIQEKFIKFLVEIYICAELKHPLKNAIARMLTSSSACLHATMVACLSTRLANLFTKTLLHSPQPAKLNLAVNVLSACCENFPMGTQAVAQCLLDALIFVNQCLHEYITLLEAERSPARKMELYQHIHAATRAVLAMFRCNGCAADGPLAAHAVHVVTRALEEPLRRLLVSEDLPLDTRTNCALVVVAARGPSGWHGLVRLAAGRSDGSSEGWYTARLSDLSRVCLVTGLLSAMGPAEVTMQPVAGEQPPLYMLLDVLLHPADRNRRSPCRLRRLGLGLEHSAAATATTTATTTATATATTAATTTATTTATGGTTGAGGFGGNMLTLTPLPTGAQAFMPSLVLAAQLRKCSAQDLRLRRSPMDSTLELAVSRALQLLARCLVALVGPLPLRPTAPQPDVGNSPATETGKGDAAMEAESPTSSGEGSANEAAGPPCVPMEVDSPHDTSVADSILSLLLSNLKALLEYVWTHLDHFMDSVRHATRGLLQSLAQLAVFYRDRGVGPEAEAVRFQNKLLNWVSALPTTHRSFYAALAVLAGELGSSVWLIRMPIVQKLLWALDDPTLRPHAAGAYEALMLAGEAALAADEVWNRRLLQPLLEVLGGPSSPDVASAVEDVLAKAVRRRPAVAQQLVVLAKPGEPPLPTHPQRLRAVLACLRIARRQGALDGAATASHLWKGVLEFSVLEDAVTHQQDELRVAALALLVEVRRSTEPLSSEELRLVRTFLRYNLSVQAPAPRQQGLALMKKLLARLRDSWAAAQRQGSAELYSTFLLWLTEFSLSNLFPGANFGRRGSCLQLLTLLVEALGERVPPCLWSGSSARLLLESLRDTYEQNKTLALQLLLRFPSPALGFTSEAHVSALLRTCLQLAASPRPPDSLTAAYVLSLIAGFSSCRAVCTAVCQVEEELVGLDLLGDRNTPVDMPAGRAELTLHLLHILAQQLSRELTQAKASLLTAAARGPLYGTLFCIRLLLQLVDLESVASSREWRELVACLLLLCHSVSLIVESVVNSDSPEGHLPMDMTLASELMEISPEPGDGKPAPDPEQGVTAQMVLLCAWRAMKEAALLLGDLAERGPLVAPGVRVAQEESAVELGTAMPTGPVWGLVTEEQLMEMGELFSRLLAEVKHRGAFEQVHVGFSKLAARLWAMPPPARPPPGCGAGPPPGLPGPELHERPARWLGELLEQIANAGRSPTGHCCGAAGTSTASSSGAGAGAKGKKLCATRRSAGVPFMVQALLTTQLQGRPSSLQATAGRAHQTFARSMGLLLQLGMSGYYTDARTHSLNILRALFRSSQLGEHVTPYVAQGVMVAIRGFKALTWQERNAATLLFSALMTRMFGVARKRDEQRMRRMTGRIFFHRYPTLFDFLLSELQFPTDVRPAPTNTPLPSQASVAAGPCPAAAAAAASSAPGSNTNTAAGQTDIDEPQVIHEEPIPMTIQLGEGNVTIPQTGIDMVHLTPSSVSVTVTDDIDLLDYSDFSPLVSPDPVVTATFTYTQPSAAGFAATLVSGANAPAGGGQLTGTVATTTTATDALDPEELDQPAVQTISIDLDDYVDDPVYTVLNPVTIAAPAPVPTTASNFSSAAASGSTSTPALIPTTAPDLSSAAASATTSTPAPIPTTASNFNSAAATASTSASSPAPANQPPPQQQAPGLTQILVPMQVAPTLQALASQLLAPQTLEQQGLGGASPAELAAELVAELATFSYSIPAGTSTAAGSGSKEAAAGAARSALPSLYPALLILSRLYPSWLEGTDSNLQLTQFVPYVEACAGCTVQRTRELAARALVPLVSSRQYVEHADRLLRLAAAHRPPSDSSGAAACPDAGSSSDASASSTAGASSDAGAQPLTWNRRHGLLLQLARLTQHYALKLWRPGQVADWLRSSSWLLTLAPESAAREPAVGPAAFLTAEAYLQVVQSWVSHAYAKVPQQQWEEVRWQLDAQLADCDRAEALPASPRTAAAGGCLYQLRAAQVLLLLEVRAPDRGQRVPALLARLLGHSSADVSVLALGFLLRLLDPATAPADADADSEDGEAEAEPHIPADAALQQRLREAPVLGQALAALLAEPQPALPAVRERGLQAVWRLPDTALPRLGAGGLLGALRWLLELAAGEQDTAGALALEAAAATLCCLQDQRGQGEVPAPLLAQLCALAERFSAPDQETATRRCVATVLVQRCELLTPFGPLPPLLRCRLWACTLLLLHDDEQEVRETVARLTGRLRPFRAPMPVVAERAQEVLLEHFKELLESEAPGLCAATLLAWALHSGFSPAPAADDMAPADERVFDRGETNAFGEEVLLCDLACRQLESLLASQPQLLHQPVDLDTRAWLQAQCWTHPVAAAARSPARRSRLFRLCRGKRRNNAGPATAPSDEFSGAGADAPTFSTLAEFVQATARRLEQAGGGTPGEMAPLLRSGGQPLLVAGYKVRRVADAVKLAPLACECSDHSDIEGE